MNMGFWYIVWFYVDIDLIYGVFQRLRNYVGPSAFTDVDLWSPM